MRRYPLRLAFYLSLERISARGLDSLSRIIEREHDAWRAELLGVGRRSARVWWVVEAECGRARVVE